MERTLPSNALTMVQSGGSCVLTELNWLKYQLISLHGWERRHGLQMEGESLMFERLLASTASPPLRRARWRSMIGRTQAPRLFFPTIAWPRRYIGYPETS